MTKSGLFFLVNGLTGLRVLLTLVFLKYMIAYRFTEISLTAVFILICLSDFFDGRMARKFGVTSIMGGRFDLFADSFFVIGATGLCVILKLLPVWYFILVVYKLVEFIGTSRFLQRKKQSDTELCSDPFGRFAAALFFIVPYISALGALKGVFPLFPALSAGVCVLIVGLIVLSSFFRWRACFQIYRSNGIGTSLSSEG